MERKRVDTPDVLQPAKKKKIDHINYDDSAECAFLEKLFDPTSVAQQREGYVKSQPYKHSVFGALFEPELLQRVQDEIVRELTFTQKETDIYKVHQTGDLASLSYLSSAELLRLPALLRLRNALYSPRFRQLMRDITGCGPLSGRKQDMSVNSYRKGCHLLNHDDVIGTRRVSYILYMPVGDNNSRLWENEWGGALELYPVRAAGDILEPDVNPSVVIPPSWNQFVFFEVQPGHSFHSVEEVIVGTLEDGRQRLSISGWFHAAQEGEDGYDAEADSDRARQDSSLAQLSSGSDIENLIGIPSSLSTERLGEGWLSDAELAELTPFLNPAYLQLQTVRALAEKFVSDSSIELCKFLKEDLASQLATLLQEADNADGLGWPRPHAIPAHTSGATSKDWSIKGPPHKHRYCVLSNEPEGEASQLLWTVRTKIFCSRGFHAWLNLVTTLVPLAYSAEARRFRPGLDYTLARAREDEPRLDVVLGLTPEPIPSEQAETWEDGNWGGWECYMAPHEGEDDPAVYRSGQGTKLNSADNENEGSEDEDEGTLLTVQARFNRLLLVLRDEGVMRFIKYVSACAPSSRWDVCGEYSVGKLEEVQG